MKNCLIFSKQNVLKLKMHFLKKKLTFQSKLRKKRNEKILKRKIKLTLLQRLKINMRQNHS